MEPKYHMTVEQNIFVAKRNIVDYIWKSAHLEGLAVTYPDTEAIFNGMSVEGVAVKDIVAVNNLKHAWQFILDNLDYPVDYNFICQINRLVGGDNLVYQAGFIRSVPVSIGGTSWKPEIPIESQIKEDLLEIRAMSEPTDRALTLMLYIMRKQMFLDGNKRTAMLAGNAEMISSGCGIISVPIEKQRDFTMLLIKYYESGDMAEIKDFLYEGCIDGIDFPEMTSHESEQQQGQTFGTM